VLVFAGNDDIRDTWSPYGFPTSRQTLGRETRSW